MASSSFSISPLSTSGQITSCEALIRWHYPERGMVAPLEFIPVAEETGLIIPLGEWVLRQVCAEAARWPKHVTIAVNLSPAQFKSRNLVPLSSTRLRHPVVRRAGWSWRSLNWCYCRTMGEHSPFFIYSAVSGLRSRWMILALAIRRSAIFAVSHSTRSRSTNHLFVIYPRGEIALRSFAPWSD